MTPVHTQRENATRWSGDRVRRDDFAPTPLRRAFDRPSTCAARHAHRGELSLGQTRHLRPSPSERSSATKIVVLGLRERREERRGSARFRRGRLRNLLRPCVLVLRDDRAVRRWCAVARCVILRQITSCRTSSSSAGGLIGARNCTTFLAPPGAWSDERSPSEACEEHSPSAKERVGGVERRWESFRAARLCHAFGAADVDGGGNADNSPFLGAGSEGALRGDGPGAGASSPPESEP